MTDQSKQVFVDETGHRSRLLRALGRVAVAMVICYLALIVAGFMGASWVPSVDLPIVGDIFDPGGQSDFQERVTDDALAATDEARQEATEAAAGSSLTAPVDDGDGARTIDGSTASASSGSEGAPEDPGNAPEGDPSDGVGEQPEAEPSPEPPSDPGSQGNSENAGPKPKSTPSPNHGSNGNSENSGPKPKATPSP